MNGILDLNTRNYHHIHNLKTPCVLIILPNGLFGRICLTELTEPQYFSDMSYLFEDRTKVDKEADTEGHKATKNQTENYGMSWCS